MNRSKMMVGLVVALSCLNLNSALAQSTRLTESDREFLESLPKEGPTVVGKAPSTLWCCIANGLWLISAEGAAFLEGYYHSSQTASGSTIAPGAVVIGSACSAANYCFSGLK